MPTFEKGETLVTLEQCTGGISVMAAASLAVLYYSLNRPSTLRNPIMESRPSHGIGFARMRNLAMAILDDERS